MLYTCIHYSLQVQRLYRKRIKTDQSGKTTQVRKPLTALKTCLTTGRVKIPLASRSITYEYAKKLLDAQVRTNDHPPRPPFFLFQKLTTYVQYNRHYFFVHKSLGRCGTDLKSTDRALTD